VRRAARKTRNSLKAQGIFKVAKKELDIPTKAPFAEKLLKEYHLDEEERKKNKRKDLVSSALNPASGSKQSEATTKLTDFESSHDKSFFSTSFSK